jgi:hypothetical protein
MPAESFFFERTNRLDGLILKVHTWDGSKICRNGLPNKCKRSFLDLAVLAFGSAGSLVFLFRRLLQHEAPDVHIHAYTISYLFKGRVLCNLRLRTQTQLPEL